MPSTNNLIPKNGNKNGQNTLLKKVITPAISSGNEYGYGLESHKKQDEVKKMIDNVVSKDIS